MDRDLRIKKSFAKTDGHCHLCHKKLTFNNYGKRNFKGAWHLDHSVPKSKGGSDHLNNILPACINCNEYKSDQATNIIRKKNGVSRAPYSKKKKNSIKSTNTTTGAIIGGVVGSIFGPIGTAIGAGIGGAIGNSSSPKK